MASQYPKDEGRDYPSSNYAYEEPCDRRLSRAARAILVDKMLPTLQHYQNALDKVPLSSLGKIDRIDYYERSLELLMDNPETCLLNPKADIYWHEESLHRLKASSTSITSRKVKRFSPNLEVHTCGICGKKFLSRFYLDYHVETKHKIKRIDDHGGVGRGEAHEGPENNRGICPAHDLCERLGGRNICEKKALEDEPFYGPGLHDESSIYSQSVKRKFQKLAQDTPCNSSGDQSGIEDCRDMFETCFGSNEHLVHDLTRFLCDTQSCHHELHSIFGSVMSIHSGREYWDSHHDDINSVGVLLILFLVCMGIYHWNTLYRIAFKYLRRRKKKTFFDVTQVKKFD